MSLRAFKEGYDVNLLDNERNRSRNVPPPLPSMVLRPTTREAVSEPKLEPHHWESSPYLATHPAKLHQAASAPWWKQRKWIVVLIIGFVICIAVIVGGAVGGTEGAQQLSS